MVTQCSRSANTAIAVKTSVANQPPRESDVDDALDQQRPRYAAAPGGVGGRHASMVVRARSGRPAPMTARPPERGA